MKDFFISYNKADKAWAEWIAWILEESGYTVLIQAWDFRPGGNFILKMHEAASETNRTIAVLSQNYLDAEYTQPEWAAAFTHDPKGEDRALIPIRVEHCTPTGLLSALIYIDLVGHSEESSRDAILEGLKERAKPDEAPDFPGLNEQPDASATERVAPNPVPFPGSSTAEGQPTSEIPWNVPPGVPFFTGREDVLNRLNQTLSEGKVAALAQRQAISGLGGIGKTQTAIAYAIRHRPDYKAVLWVVAESRESLISDFVAIASLLDLPERNIQDQNLVVSAVRRWLEASTDWLLILDNADEPALIEEFLPSGSNGDILLTSRAQVFDQIGILNPIEMEEMSPEDATEFILRRTGRRDLELDEAEAVEQLTFELNYLPLALEQAGAYIKELRSSFQDYLVSYRKRGLELLEKGAVAGKDRKSVRTTWSLNFQQVEESSKPSADLLRVSAFLSPDRIPNELISLGASYLGSELSTALANVDSDPLALDEVLKPLIRYSLIHRDRKSRTYDIHRLVQAVLKEAMDDGEKRLWSERTVNAVAHVLPEVDLQDLSMWTRIERILPHAQACSQLIESWSIASLNAAQLLNNIGRYVHFRARLTEAELLYDRSLAIRHRLLGPDHSDVASSLHNQAWLYFDQGKYSVAEPLFLRSLSIREHILDPNDLEISTSLLNLGNCYVSLGRYNEAAPLIARSLRIREKVLGPEHPDLVDVFMAQGNLFYDLDQTADAEFLVSRSLNIAEKKLGKDHPDIASILTSLAEIYKVNDRLDEAEAFILRSLKITETVFGENYPMVAGCLHNLADLYIQMGRCAEADPVIARSLEIVKEVLGQEHPKVAISLHTLAKLRESEDRSAEAEALYLESITLKEKSLGPEHVVLSHSLLRLGMLYHNQHKSYKGEPFVRRALSIQKKVLGPTHLRVVNTMFAYAEVLKGMNRKGEAQRIEAQARNIQAKSHKKTKKRK